MLHDYAFQLIRQGIGKGLSGIFGDRDQQTGKQGMDRIAAGHRKYQGSGVGGLQKHVQFFHGFQMVKANHVSAVPHGKFNASDTRAHVKPHFLLDQGADTALEQALYGAFHRLNIAGAVCCDSLGKRRYRGGTSACRGARHQHQTTIEACKLHAEGRKVQRIQRGSFCRYHPDGYTGHNAIPSDRDAGTTHASQCNGAAKILACHYIVTIGKAF